MGENSAAQRNKELEYILMLDKELHGMQEKTFEPNISGKPFPVWIDTYTEQKMTPDQARCLLQIIDESMEYFIFPINTASRFGVGFEVAQARGGEKKMLLRFKEEQLPEGYNFKKLSEYFMSKNNLIKAHLSGVDNIQNNRTHYTY